MTSVMAGMTVVMETAAPLAIFSRWARVVLVPSLFLMQAGIWVLMGIAFREFLVLYLVWVPWDRIGDWLNKRASIRPAYAVLYDGSCGVCQATIRVVRSLDLLARVHGYDVHGDWDDIARRYPALTQHACLEHMHVITPTGRRRVGFEGYRALAWAIPVGWLALPLLYLPGARVLGRRVYSAVASRRSCPLDGRLEHPHASQSGDRGNSQTALRP
jgi:predicted DCC family thiol-disulfide oxidoreductase YuxK